MSIGECIWVSRTLSSSVNNAGFMTDLLERNRERAFDCHSRNRHGESLAADCMPTKGWLLPEDSKRKKLSQFATAGSFFYMAEKCADVFRQFDLGSGGLYPIELFEADGVTLLPETCFALNFGNVKSCFLPEHSTNIYPAPKKTYDPSPIFEDGDLVFTASALEGPDVWINPGLQHSFCMSDRLAHALAQNDLLQYFERIRRGRIVT